MTLLKTLKILLISTLSLALFSCAGTPPKLEHPVNLYDGTPSRTSMCRKTKESLIQQLQTWAQYGFTKAHVRSAVGGFLAQQEPAALDCIRADSPGFASMVGMPADDLRVLLQYIENLLYSCEKWKQ